MQDHGWSVEVKLAGPDAASVAAARRQLEEQWLRVCPRVLFAWAVGEDSESEESVFLVPGASALRFDPTPIATYWTNSAAFGARAVRSWGGCVSAILLAAASYSLIVGSICAHDAPPSIEIAVHLVSAVVTLSVASSRFSRTLALQAVRYGDVWCMSSPRTQRSCGRAA
jgi:coenzyme F420-reducing hydrogenase beta subunit